MFPIPNPLTTYEIIQFLISYTFGSNSNLLDLLPPSSLRQRRRRSKRQKQISIMMIKSRKTCYCSLFLFLFILSVATTTVIHGKTTPTLTSNNDVVIAIGISNNIYTYKRFIGSLRHSGYNGLIVLARPGHSYDNLPTSKHIEKYLEENNVTIKYVEATTDCHNHALSLSEENEQLSKLNNNNNKNHYCIKPYTDLKMSWSGYTLARDWLHDECIVKQKCSNSIDGGGRVLLSPLHHIYFQRNPFTDTSMTKNNNSIMKPFLYLYEDHPSKTINDNHALLQCKKFLWDVPFISSIVYSDVSSMSFYLENVIKEAYEWMNKSECYLSNSGIAIHNFLFYNGVISPNSDDGSQGIVRYRQGIVNSVDIIGKYYREYVWKKSDDEEEWTTVSKFLQNDKHIDEQGYFLNVDGTKSAIVLHYEAFGLPLQRWLFKQDFFTSYNNDAMEKQGIIGSDDNPLDNPFFYLSLESSRYFSDTDKIFLRNRHVMGKVVHEELS